MSRTPGESGVALIGISRPRLPQAPPDGGGERRVGRGAGHAGKFGIHACGEFAALRQPECRRGERARVGALRDRECAQRQGIRLNYIYMYMQPDTMP